MSSPYRTQGPGDPDEPITLVGKTGLRPLDEYLRELATERDGWPFTYLPLCETTINAGTTAMITARPQRPCTVRGLLFDPQCAPDVVLVAFQAARETPFFCYGEVPGRLLTFDPGHPTIEQVLMAARFNPIVCQIGNDISLSVRAERDCVVRAVVLTEPAPDYATSKTLREVHELLQRYEQQAASDNRRIADLVLELEHLRRELRPTEPAPTQSIDERCEQTALGVRCILARGHSGSHMGNGPGGWKDDDNDNGAWMTPTDES